jgi:hypothetical protein
MLMRRSFATPLIKPALPCSFVFHVLRGDLLGTLQRRRRQVSLVLLESLRPAFHRMEHVQDEAQRLFSLLCFVPILIKRNLQTCGNNELSSRFFRSFGQLPTRGSYPRLHVRHVDQTLGFGWRSRWSVRWAAGPSAPQSTAEENHQCPFTQRSLLSIHTIQDHLLSPIHQCCLDHFVIRNTRVSFQNERQCQECWGTGGCPRSVSRYSFANFSWNVSSKSSWRCWRKNTHNFALLMCLTMDSSLAESSMGGCQSHGCMLACSPSQ